MSIPPSRMGRPFSRTSNAMALARRVEVVLRFRCPRCGFSGGVFDLYAYYAGISRDSVREALIARLDVRGDIPKPKPIKVEEVPECPLADVDDRHATYSALLSRLSLATDHRENLLSRGLNLEQIERLGYKTTPVVGTSSRASA